MDPLSHAVIGRAAAALVGDGRRMARGAGAAAILGALSPDVDVLVIPRGWDVYLRAHESGTHSIAGALAAAACSAAMVRWFTRGSRYPPLLAAAAVGAMTHLALDVVSGGRVRIAWPFAQTRITLPLVAMADPWLLAICIAGALALWPGHRPLRTVAYVVLGVTIGFFSVKAVMFERALRTSNLTPPVVIEADWGSLTRWHAFARTSGSLRAWMMDSRGGPAVLLWSWPVPPESARETTSRSLETVRNFLRIHELGFPTEESEGADRTGVFWSDIRFCSPPPTTDARIACGLWFGGVFGPDGRILTQEVKVGHWVQTRAAGR